MPIQVKDIRLNVELRLTMEFYPEAPYIRWVDITFRNLKPTWLGFEIKIMGALNVMSLPSIKDWLTAAITASVRDMMLMPKKLHIPVGGKRSTVLVSV